MRLCVCIPVCSSGIELVFVGTKSGLTRYLTLADNLTDPSVKFLPICFNILFSATAAHHVW